MPTPSPSRHKSPSSQQREPTKKAKPRVRPAPIHPPGPRSQVPRSPRTHPLTPPPQKRHPHKGRPPFPPILSPPPSVSIQVHPPPKPPTFFPPRYLPRRHTFFLPLFLFSLFAYIILRHSASRHSATSPPGWFPDLRLRIPARFRPHPYRDRQQSCPWYFPPAPTTRRVLACTRARPVVSRQKKKQQQQAARNHTSLSSISDSPSQQPGTIATSSKHRRHLHIFVYWHLIRSARSSLLVTVSHRLSIGLCCMPRDS